MNLDNDVETLNGVGEKTAKALKKYGIRTVRDFLYNLPRSYDNYDAPTTIAELRPGKVVVKGKIDSLANKQTRRRNLTITEGVIRDDTGAIKVIWFNQAYRTKQFHPDKEYYFTGNYELRNGRYSLVAPSTAEAHAANSSGGLNPIYVAHGTLKSNDFQRLMAKSRDIFINIPDILPFVPPGIRGTALFNAHFPDTEQQIKDSREYLAYEELFELILASKLNRRENEKLQAEPIKFEATKIREFVGRLPFRLTDAQRRAAWEIFQDMEKPVPMNRLLQGDVGAGKTVVAAMSAYEAYLSKVQTAILAPTAILALQHFEGLSQLLEPFGVKVALLTGATKQKPALKKQIESGKIDLVIGTHALLTDDTSFKHLGMVVIDEQHRFGVSQRQKLILKSPQGLAPHLLAMTATPIPRSLQLTVFGDLDVSILNQLPAGRQPIATSIIAEIEINGILYPKMREILAMPPDAKKHGKKAHGQQIYWICKAIEDESEGKANAKHGRSNDKSKTQPSSGSDVTSVKRRCKKLQEIFPERTIEFLHGKMKPTEKDAVMERFAEGEIDILVSTTVVEVGVDVPNATMIVIENAEDYGLAQLHQLRGRVGRGVSAAYCYLITSGDTKPSRRLKELSRSNDGFYLAEVDLKIRGPGEIYGALQHGALDLRIASLSDTRTIARARKDVDKFLQEPENMVKYQELMHGITKYQQITTLN
ncbi:ATP-dependent DNA helicase RecG [Candidatus Saccharibacteria bacterium]|nr:ATP-dependent DNA helicase RecG [Candidatus Saccharibacteria bacterium]